MIKIAVFASGSGTNAENVASYFAAGEKARVTLILSNYEDVLNQNGQTSYGDM